MALLHDSTRSFATLCQWSPSSEVELQRSLALLSSFQIWTDATTAPDVQRLIQWTHTINSKRGLTDGTTPVYPDKLNTDPLPQRNDQALGVERRGNSAVLEFSLNRDGRRH
jgi:hypothetical protein